MKRFATIEDALAHVRECNNPQIVIIDGEQWQLFPSGQGRQLTFTMLTKQDLAKGAA